MTRAGVNLTIAVAFGLVFGLAAVEPASACRNCRVVHSPAKIGKGNFAGETSRHRGVTPFSGRLERRGGGTSPLSPRVRDLNHNFAGSAQPFASPFQFGHFRAW